MALLLAMSAFGYYRMVIWPRENFRQVCENPDSTEDELREAIHQLIAWNPNHEGFILLNSVGDDSSIPLLIRNIRRVPEADVTAGKVECTWGHCRKALVALTGEDFGYDAEKWQAWYENR
ncbi:hypothetical protein JIN85_05985 [Luteolibacter pohnpeiensis]|uniref:Uncharacterized protein n=2 Tax=Luteolibacter pohnpeiensis TaxID=454153 RepID=A0A934S636_9BACT|nr:hypothetical protein [Luteolibacter pohnpeiensis]